MAQERNSQFFSILQSDYAAWLTQVLLSALYEKSTERKQIIFPSMLSDNPDHNASIPSRVKDSQEILHELAKNILNSSEQLSRETMETFLVTFENFQSALQALENGIMYADFGIDELTGMFTQDRMFAELERELERRSRRGQPFCFVISQIDGENEKINTQNIIQAAKAIQKTIRSFDDAYIIEDGEFLSSLKHSDQSGGLKFVSRLNKILELELDAPFTMSSIVAEPLPGDSIAQLIRGAKDDLKARSIDSAGVTEEYKEISPLGKYLKSLKE